ncbi:MAG TPA: radical SAM protein, partial [bacterium]|nr:radical SAM protein [bacterium]
IDEELLAAMKKAGLIRLSFGIESGDPEILKKIKKSVTLEQIKAAYKAAAKVGIETRGSAMLGHPYETRKTAWRTLKFIRGIKECLQIYLNVACPYPGTELYECAVKGEGGMRLLTTDYTQYKRYGDPVIEVNDLSSRDLKRLQTIGLFYFYLTPRRVWYNVFKRAGLRAGIKNVLAVLIGAFNALSGKRK